jgi:chromosome segregation ATPase
MILSTVLAIIGCASTVVLLGVIVWLRDEYLHEMRAATQTMKNQKSIIEVMSNSHNVNFEKIGAFEATVSDRDKTLSSLLSETQNLRGLIEGHKEKIQRLEYLVDLEEQTVVERDKTIDELNAMTLQRDRLLEVIKLRDETIVNREHEISAHNAEHFRLSETLESTASTCRAIGKKVTAITDKLRCVAIEKDRLLAELKSRDDKLSRLIARNRELIAQVDGLKYSTKTRGGHVPDLNTAWHMKGNPLDVKQKYLLDDTPLDDNGSGVIDSQPYGE